MIVSNCWGFQLKSHKKFSWCSSFNLNASEGGGGGSDFIVINNILVLTRPNAPINVIPQGI